MTASEFQKWLSASRPGAMVIYHTGFLATDRYKIIDLTGPFSVPEKRLNDLGNAVIKAFDEDKVHLFQRKLHDREYQYIAVKKSRRLW